MPRYMLAFIDVNSDNNTITRASFEYDAPYPFRSMADVDELTDVFRRQQNLTDPTLMGFSRFEGDES